MKMVAINKSILINDIKVYIKDAFIAAVLANFEVLFFLFIYLILTFFTFFIFSDITKLKIITFNEYYTLVFVLASCIILSIKTAQRKRDIYFIFDKTFNATFIFLLLPVFVCTFSSYKQLIPAINNYKWDNIFMKIDRSLHFGHDPWQLFTPVLDNYFIVQLIDNLYMLWFVVLFLFSVYMGLTGNTYLKKNFSSALFSSGVDLAHVSALCSQVPGHAILIKSPIARHPIHL